MTRSIDELAVGIVSYNCAEWLPACLASLSDARPVLPLRVVVVDNASSDGSADLVRRDFPWVEVRENGTNRGYACGVNEAFRGSAASYGLVLNPDTVVEPGALQVLHGYLEQHPDVGLVAPRLVNPDLSLQYSCRRHYTPATYLLRRSPLRRLFPGHPVVRRHLMADWDHDQVRQVDWVLGAAMMVRRAAAGEPMMDERYFLYFEDVDLCLRLQRAGWRVIYHPEAVMVHHHRRKSGDVELRREKYEHLRSWLKFHWKHRSLVPGRPQR